MMSPVLKVYTKFILRGWPQRQQETAVSLYEGASPRVTDLDSALTSDKHGIGL